MAECIDCHLNSYSGDHSQCPKKSFVCKRGKIYRFTFLPAKAKGSLIINGDNIKTIRKILVSRTCHKALWSTRFETSTQKAESVNSAFKTTNPKHSVTFSRNARFRDHSAIHMVNNGPGESMAP